MQIAIVDDRAEDREELSVCLENYMKKHQLDYTLTEFEDGENFLKAAAQVNFQLVFMDIYMDYISQVDSQTFRLINGEELPIALRNGKQLRETYRQYVFSGMGGIV